ncbi:DEAD/DEAH box helicase [Brachybacterium sp. EF45031]|uniref:DEAD/DEAH box helicase n=1 Tax=Brachybacterium sillae TaxID=2810536 RepID=UPI00217CCC05|nr:DEAD/DEAH box helicase [Brachybacterium sillae]MCS6712732.1 DEAD/DEAH box helicase [Brachybacterium sillae]
MTDVAPTPPTEPADDAASAPAEDVARTDTHGGLDAADGAPVPAGFDALGLTPELRRAVDALGYRTPSPIQEQAIPALLSGRDVIGVAQTGTGKTAAFGLPLLAAVDPQVRDVQALVLAPTRELAMQVADAISSFAAQVAQLEVVAVYGGSPYGPQERALARGAQVVVGTPGRVMDHMRKGTLRLDAVRYAVLDEADEMLRMGFAEDVEEILSHSPATRQVALFSATMPPAIERVAEEHMTDPVKVTVARQSTTVANVTQRYAVVPFRHKTGALVRVLATSPAQAAIVFVRTRSAAEEVGAALVTQGIVAATISGDVPQKERERIVERLRDGSLTVLVATDVAARGLDVERIGLVVNFDVPREPEAYVHRIGRTGRAGRTGDAVTFVAPHERRTLRAIEKATRQQIEEMTVPSPRDVSRHRFAQLLERLPEREERGRLDLYTEMLSEYLERTGADPARLAAVLGALAIGDEGPAADAPAEEEFERASFRGEERRGRDRHDRDGEDDPEGRGHRGRPERSPRPEPGYTAYRVAVGHAQGVKPGAIVGALTGEGGLTGKEVGKISIFGSFSIVQLKGRLSPEQLDRLGSARIGGRALRVSPDRGPRRDRDDRNDRRGRDERRDRAGRDDREDRRGRGERREWRGERRDWDDRGPRGDRTGARHDRFQAKKARGPRHHDR